MVNTIEANGPSASRYWRPVTCSNRTAPYERLRHGIASIQKVSWFLLRQRIRSIISLCSIVWLTSIWPAVAIAQAQESPSNNAGITVTQPAIAQRSIEKTETRRLVLSMAERSDLEAHTPRSSAAQLTNPHPTDAQNAGVLLPPNPRGTEYASLAALASAPSSSPLYAIQAKGSGQTDTGFPASDNKAFVYQFGTVNFVINGLPSSLSVSSAGSSLSGAR